MTASLSAGAGKWMNVTDDTQPRPLSFEPVRFSYARTMADNDRYGARAASGHGRMAAVKLRLETLDLGPDRIGDGQPIAFEAAPGLEKQLQPLTKLIIRHPQHTHATSN